MRSDRIGVAVAVALASAALDPLPVSSQETALPFAGAAEAPPVHEELKRIAQQAAIPHLSGERPFILRESSWSGQVEPGKARLIQIQLFKRNDYQFWFAVPDRRAGVLLNLYNGKGELVAGDLVEYETSNIVSLVASPSETGIHYLRISMGTSIGDSQPWTVIYAYR